MSHLSRDTHKEEPSLAQSADEPAKPQRASGFAAPDGGLEAWLVALGCFFAFLASFGFV